MSKITITKSKNGLDGDLFLWPEYTKERWQAEAYPKGRWTNTNLVLKLRDIRPAGSDWYSLLDIGCGNGLFVMDVINSGNLGVGIDGCHYYQDFPGFLWEAYPDQAFLCDVSQPYQLEYEDRPLTFDYVTSWEHLEHLRENQLDTWMQNLVKHCHIGSRCFFSISHDDNEYAHFTIKDYDSWMNLFRGYGFEFDEEFCEAVSSYPVRNCPLSQFFYLVKK